MSARWSKEDLAAAQARMARSGSVKTHMIADGKSPRRPDDSRRKYGNKPHNGFPSKKEHDRYQDLALLHTAGKIFDLQRQVSFDLVVNGMFVCRYVADFSYIENRKRVVEDAKGFQTKEFRLKAKLMKAIHNIEIKIT